MQYLLGVLNSKLLSFLYPILSNKMIAQSFPRLSVRDVKRLPIRSINFSDPIDKARHDKMVTLVEQMLDLHKRKATATDTAGQERLQRLIDSTDKQIDALVYELYGLTLKEIAIVENAGK
jgi:hypothetical protein